MRMRSRSEAAVISRPPSLPMATITAPPPRHATVRPHHLALHLGLHGGDDAFGQQCVGAAGLGGGDGAGQHAHADQELLLAGEQARAIEHLLEVGGTLELGGDQGIEAGAVGQAAEEARIEHGIERAAALAQDAREPRRRAHDGGDQLEQARVLFQQREQLHAGRQLGQEAVEADEGQVGIGGIGQRLDQRRLHLGQQLAGARRCARPGSGRDASRAPGR